MKNVRVSQPDWLAADWGTSRLRIWGMRANGEVIGRQFGDWACPVLQEMNLRRNS